MALGCVSGNPNINRGIVNGKVKEKTYSQEGQYPR